MFSTNGSVRGGRSTVVLVRTAILVAVFLLFILTSSTLRGAPVSHAIKLDYFGYRTGDTKVAIVSANPGATVQIRRTDDTVAYTIPTNGGSIVSKGSDGAASGDTVWWVDFSGFTTPGTYRLYSATLAGQSYDFEIRDDIYNDVALTALKTFYYQRCNTPKLATHAGNWSDPQACHMADATTTAASGHTNFGTKNLTGGWHDAGDYNKYVWSAVSSAVLLMLRAYEDNPGRFVDGDLNIPESGNGVPDILDEIKYELDWLLKMQLPDGRVLYQMHVPGFASDSPPSADTNLRYYQNPNLESGGVLAGTLAFASRIFAAQGNATYANTLKTAALNSWTWLNAQPACNTSNGDCKIKVWAAAEIFRLDSSVTSARNFVDSYYPNNWAGRFFDPPHYDSHAAFTYVQTPGATATTVANMRQDVSDQVNFLFSNNDLYRNGMPNWEYYWGSNSPRATIGLFLLQAAKIGATGSRTPAECIAHAQDFLHFFHGQNAMNMVYLTNMASRGGEHSSWQFYHAWFGDTNNSYSRSNYVGKPTGVTEPDYPYFKGTDNLGANDNKSSLLGPAPGFVPGGPNFSYSGLAVPPGSASAWNRAYRDWNDQTVNWQAMTWEITENSIGYQGPYVALAAYFMGSPAPPQCTTNAQCDDGNFCNGAETCNAGGSCVAGTDPCPGISCNEETDSCETPVCNSNGTCESGEDCNNCPSDCISGGGGGCGNGVCEPALGEDCLSCPADCSGRTGGSPSKRYCCGDGAGPNPVGCSDARCTTNGFACSNTTVPPFCCGDGACSAGAESSCSCGIDCGLPPAFEAVNGACSDSIDNDCDLVADCADNDCSADPFCAAPPPPACDGDGICEAGENCNNCSDCAGKPNGPPSGRYCCGDGTQQPPEGNGAWDPLESTCRHASLSIL